MHGASTSAMSSGVPIEKTQSRDRSGLLLRTLAGRCQMMAAPAADRSPSAVISEVRNVLLDLPDGMTVPEKFIACSLIGQMLARIVRLSGIDSCPEVARAFIDFIEAGGRSRDWRMRLVRVVDCCEAALGSGVTVELTLDDRVARAMRYIQEHGGDGRLTLPQLARTVHVSPWHLARMIKRQTGQGFVAHLHQVRIAAACRRLEQTGLSVKEIAGAVGYDSSSQFDRRFKRQVGVTPLSYRRSMFDRLRQSS
jgi:AraC-like DNA-binding protein